METNGDRTPRTQRCLLCPRPRCLSNRPSVWYYFYRTYTLDRHKKRTGADQNGREDPAGRLLALSASKALDRSSWAGNRARSRFHPARLNECGGKLWLAIH